MENMNSKKIKNIVFDLGRVLIKFEPKEYTEKNIPEEKREAFYNGIFGSDEWQMLDRGTLSYEDAKKIFIEGKEFDNSFAPFYYNLSLIERQGGNYNSAKEYAQKAYELNKIDKYKNLVDELSKY